VECAALEVPLDREVPEGASVSLAVRRLPAADPDQRLGVLVTLAGGPGQRGTDGVYPEAHSPLIASRFDIVSFDPRGTSGETAITCIPEWDPFGDLDRTPDDSSEREALDARIRELATECRDAHAGVLPHVGTSDTVLDVEALREALGEDQISLLGSSYGSEVALRYATAFPDRTRAVVLDGYSDPNIAPPGGELEQVAAFERQLDELLVECALREECPIDSSDPGASLDRLLHDLDEAPVQAGRGRVLRQSDAYEAIAGALVRGPRARERLLHGIAAAGRGDGSELLGLADEVRAEFEASGLDLGSYMAIACADDGAAWWELSDEEVSALTDHVLEVAPRLGPWLWSPPMADDLPPVGLCAMASRDGPRVPGPFDGHGAGPILVLAASGDPTTPLSAALRAVDDLEEAWLLAIRADRHLVYPYAVAAPGSATGRCVLDALESYLIDGVIPKNDSCP
jgi:pimeloyl-ACP methyl ester carboxylesterase